MTREAESWFNEWGPKIENLQRKSHRAGYIFGNSKKEQGKFWKYVAVLDKLCKLQRETKNELNKKLAIKIEREAMEVGK
jgi:hypothetical protein